MRWIIICGFVIVAIYLFISKGQKSFAPQGKYAELIQSGVLYSVVRVIDGDTVIVHVSGHDLTLRLIGMDTPEVVDPRKPVQCYGPEASAEGKTLLSGKQVYLETEATGDAYDIYGRVLAYVKMSDGTLYDEYMIQQGFAREYTFKNNSYKYQSQFKADQAQAQKEKLGLWGKCPTST